MTPPQQANQIINQIEAELKRLGRWSAEPPPPEAFENMRPFGMHALAFEQWLQFVLIPRVREIIATHGAFPTSSQVGTYAVRELDGDPEADHLISLLTEFDSLF